MATVRFDPGDVAALPLDAISHLADQSIERHPEILGLHVCLTDMQASSVETAERRARGAPTQVPSAAILVEGTDPAVLSRFCAQELSADALRSIGLDTATNTGIYRLEFCLAAGEEPSA